MTRVVVTGASRGLGLSMAGALAAVGYDVTAVARSSTEALVAAIEEASVRAKGSIEFCAYDLADTAGIPAFVRSLRKGREPIYGLVNNAGIGTSGALGIMGDPDIERLFRLNSISPIILTKYIARSMMLEKSGRIVNIASVVALTGYSGLSVYSATKASLVGFTRSLAREVGPLGITVNAIAPGFVDTHMTDRLNPEDRERIARRSALRRLIAPEDVARNVEFLLGDGGRHITGSVITIDAGNTA